MKEQSNLVAVVLAAGRGTRLRQVGSGSDTSVPALRKDQERAAATGIKALMPVRRPGDPGRLTQPLVAYTLEAMAAVGIERVCFVVRPELQNPAQHFPSHPRIDTAFAVQQEPRGTADAVASAHDVVGCSDLLVLNSDTVYPRSALHQLVQAGAPALIALNGHAVAENPSSNLTTELMAQWAAVSVDNGGMLKQVLDPPGAAPQSPWWVNINAWRFDQRIFDACEALAQAAREPASAGPRTELELPRAVDLSRHQFGVRYRVLKCAAPILDLTSRTDVSVVERLLPTLN